MPDHRCGWSSGSWAVGLAACLWMTLPARALEIFSEGMEVPETISPIPDGWGELSGDYLVPDFGFGGAQVGQSEHIWLVPQEGGDPTSFATLDFAPRGGLFLPDSFGALGGQFLAAGEQALSGGQFLGRIVTLDAQANQTALLTSGTYDSLTTPVIAPAGFGSHGGQLLITNQLSGVITVSPSGGVSEFFNALSYRSQTQLDVIPFGAEFAPAGFGEHGGKLFVTDGRTTPGEAKLHVLAIDAQGNAELFLTVALTPQQAAIDAGLRQLAFVPDGFGVLTGKMLLSVSGSLTGGGALGELLVINRHAEIIGKLKIGQEITKFDPRGVYFRDDGSILISDGSDPILIACPGDFYIPEPVTAWVYLFTLAALRRRR